MLLISFFEAALGTHHAGTIGVFLFVAFPCGAGALFAYLGRLFNGALFISGIGAGARDVGVGPVFHCH